MNLSVNTATPCNYEEAGALIRAAETILIITHYRPDGDAIGSTLALGASLQELGKQVVCVNQDATPATLSFLENSGLAMVTGSAPDLRVFQGAVDLVIALDCATIERLGGELVTALPAAPVLTIDHHITNEHYGDHLILEPTSAATGEIIYGLLVENDFPIPAQTRDCLYVAISTDTGSLQYTNATESTYGVMTKLVGLGADVAALNTQTYFTHSVRRIEILRECLKGFQLACEGQVSYWTVSHEAQQSVGVQRGDMEGLMDIIRGLSSVRVCFTLEESASGAVRLSIRSKDAEVDVSQVCAHFGGGGHKMAAGATLDLPLEKSAEQVLAVLEKAL